MTTRVLRYPTLQNTSTGVISTAVCINALAIRDANVHDPSTDTPGINTFLVDMHQLPGSRMLYVGNSLNQPVTVTLLTSYDSVVLIEVATGVVAASATPVYLDTVSIPQLANPYPVLGVRVVSGTPPTSGTLTVAIVGASVGGAVSTFSIGEVDIGEEVTIVGSLPAGSNVIGTVTLNSSALSIGTVGLDAGTNSVGTIGLDEGTNSIGTVGLDIGTNSVGTVGLDTGLNTIGKVDLNTGSNTIGKVDINSGTNTIGKIDLNAGSNTIGKVGLVAGVASVGTVGLNAGSNTIGNVGLTTGSIPAQNTVATALIAYGPQTTNTSSTDQTNTNARGVSVFIKTGAFAGDASAITVSVEGKDTISGSYYTILASSSLLANSFYVMEVYPSLLPVTNSIASALLPYNWRVSIAGTWGTGGSILGVSFGMQA